MLIITAILLVLSLILFITNLIIQDYGAALFIGFITLINCFTFGHEFRKWKNEKAQEEVVYTLQKDDYQIDTLVTNSKDTTYIIRIQPSRVQD